MRILCTVALLVAAGCGKNKDSDSGTTTGWTEDSSPSSGTPSGATDSDSGTGTVPTDTLYVGEATIDLGAATWSGTEKVVVENASTGGLLCEWTWSATDWASDPAVKTQTEPSVEACTDGDGNPCTFAFTVNLSNGLQTCGNCGTFYGADGGSYHYAYMDDWYNAGSSYGTQLAYYLQTTKTSGTWFPAMSYGTATWSPGTGQDGTLSYELQKTLLSTITP